ncbi:unnamed protein product [Pylaiella littoralis]
MWARGLVVSSTVSRGGISSLTRIYVPRDRERRERGHSRGKIKDRHRAAAVTLSSSRVFCCCRLRIGNMRRPPLLLVFVLAPPCLSSTLASKARHEGQALQHEHYLPSTARSHASSSHRSSNSNRRSRTASRLSNTDTTTTAPRAAFCVLRGGGDGEATSAAATTVTTPIAAADPTAVQESSTSTTGDTTTTSSGGGLKQRAKVLGYFGLWYALNVWYNIVNKKVLNALPLPSSIAVLQLGIGSLWVGTQWLVGIRSPPGKLTSAGAARLTPVAFFHGGGQLATVLSLGAGAVSFTHVVKAMEPFFSALVAAVCFRQVFRWQVYASLLPVVAGVSLACAKEINFSWVSFLAAMASNLLFACRANFSKALMTRPPFRGGASTSSANLYGLVTLVSFMVFAPWAALTGRSEWEPAWQAAMERGYQGRTLALSVVLSGVSHYLNNEVMYLALGSVHPTTLAVGNTMKRVFIVVASLLVFKTPISKLGMVGSAIAVAGVLVYSLARQHYGVLDEKIKQNQHHHHHQHQQ